MVGRTASTVTNMTITPTIFSESIIMWKYGNASSYSEKCAPCSCPAEEVEKGGREKAGTWKYGNTSTYSYTCVHALQNKENAGREKAGIKQFETLNFQTLDTVRWHTCYGKERKKESKKERKKERKLSPLSPPLFLAHTFVPKSSLIAIRPPHFLPFLDSPLVACYSHVSCFSAHGNRNVAYDIVVCLISAMDGMSAWYCILFFPWFFFPVSLFPFQTSDFSLL